MTTVTGIPKIQCQPNDHFTNFHNTMEMGTTIWFMAQVDAMLKKAVANMAHIRPPLNHLVTSSRTSIKNDFVSACNLLTLSYHVRLRTKNLPEVIIEIAAWNHQAGCQNHFMNMNFKIPYAVDKAVRGKRQSSHMLQLTAAKGE